MHKHIREVTSIRITKQFKNNIRSKDKLLSQNSLFNLKANNYIDTKRDRYKVYNYKGKLHQ